MVDRRPDAAADASRTMTGRMGVQAIPGGDGILIRRMQKNPF
jgi:hypothetical protein